MAKKTQPLHPDAPLLHNDHRRPVTRREFIKQGFVSGGAMVTGSALLNMFIDPREANAVLSQDIIDAAQAAGCPVNRSGAGKIPFIAFDLGGGANFAGSNVIVGGPGGQPDAGSVSAAGYNRLGIPGDRLPDPSGTGNFVDNTLGLSFHTESGLLAGILDRVSPGCIAGINGAIIPARSDNDTGNNPHNPMYGIAKTGADGGLLTLIGSVASESGARSMSPAIYLDPEIRPTKVDRPSDVTGLVDTGDLLGILNQDDAVSVMEAVSRLSDARISGFDPLMAGTTGDDMKKILRCGYYSAADIANRFADPQQLNPSADAEIVGPTRGNMGAGSIFTTGEFSDREFQKTASVMKLVLGTLAGAGSITMGGYDYHTGNRATGERRDIRAGRCIGACLEYAHRMGRPLFLYVYSDGSVFSNGDTDDTQITDGNIVLPGGKGVWTGDNSGGAASLIFVYNPSSSAPGSVGARPAIRGVTAAAQAARQQLGYFRSNGSVETTARTPGGHPIGAANNVDLLVNTVIMNYMAMHYDLNSQMGTFLSDFKSLFPNHNLGSDAALDELLIFDTLSSIDTVNHIMA